MKKKLGIAISLSLVLLSLAAIFSATSTVITVYNTIVQSKVAVDEAVGNLESCYQRRYALVGNLVTIVKETKDFESYQIEIEKNLYPAVATAKAQATKLDIALPKEGGQRIAQEAQLTTLLSQALDKLLVLAQHYPTITDPVLKDRTATFTALQDLKASLTDIENDIQRGRQAINASVRIYNQNIQLFPANVFATAWHHTPLQGFTVQSPEARQDVKIAF